MKSEKVILINALMNAHNAFVRAMTDSGYHIFWDDDGNGKIYKKPTRVGDWPVGTVKITWEVKKNAV